MKKSKFLKERGLNKDSLQNKNIKKAINQYNKIKWKKTLVVNIDGHEKKIITHKKGNKTIVRDFNTLNILATTQKYNTRNIQKGFLNHITTTTKTITRIRGGIKKVTYPDQKSYISKTGEKRVKKGKALITYIGGTKVKEKVTTTKIQKGIKLKLLFTEKYENVKVEHRQTALRKKFGKLFMSVTFKGKNNQIKVVEGGSQTTRILSRHNERTKALNEAFKGALSLINFSYDTFQINWVHYAYYSNTKMNVPR